MSSRFLKRVLPRLTDWPMADEGAPLPVIIRALNNYLPPLTLLQIDIDGGGLAITSGVKLDIPLPRYDCTIVGWDMVADQVGSIQIDLWRAAYASFPPTVANTITAAAKPILATANKATATNVDTWSFNCTAGDVIRVNVDSAATVTRVALALSLLHR